MDQPESHPPVTVWHDTSGGFQHTASNVAPAPQGTAPNQAKQDVTQDAALKFSWAHTALSTRDRVEEGAGGTVRASRTLSSCCAQAGAVAGLKLNFEAVPELILLFGRKSESAWLTAGSSDGRLTSQGTPCVIQGGLKLTWMDYKRDWTTRVA